MKELPATRAAGMRWGSAVGMGPSCMTHPLPFQIPVCAAPLHAGSEGLDYHVHYLCHLACES